MKNRVIFIFLLIACSNTSDASEISEEIALLKQQIKILSEKIEKLESATTQTNKPQVTVAPDIPSSAKKTWSNRISFNADLRDRFEYIDQKDQATRTRNRIRFRFGAQMQVNDNLDIGFRLASGSDDPTSTNQTLDDAFSSKDIRLDLAYFDYHLNDVFSLTGGKMKNPLYKPGKNPIMWDGDLNPEGFALNIDNNLLHAAFFGFSLDEKKADDDTLLFGGQVMHGFKISDSGKLVAGLGYYDYQNLKGSAPLFDEKPHGNTLDSNGTIANDFNIIEAFLEYKTKLANQPLSVYANHYQNTQANDLDTAYTIGVSYGKVKNFASWSLGYAYLDIEADAVYGLLNDSDFAGGNTDSKGHLIKAGYGLNKNTALGLTYIDSEMNQSQSEQTDYDRVQLDFKLSFK